MPAGQITTYLAEPLADRLKAARQDGFEPKDTVVAALERALDEREGKVVPETLHADTVQLDRLAAVLGQDDIRPLWIGQEGGAVDIAITLIATLASITKDGPSTIIEPDPDGSDPTELQGNLKFEVQWADNPMQLQAKLDAILAGGGEPTSIAIDTKDRIAILTAWVD